MNNNIISKKPKFTVVIAVVVAAVVLLNVAMQLLPDSVRAFDITSSRSYTVSEKTKAYFASVNDKVTIYVLDADGSDVKFEYLMDRIDGISENISVEWTTLEKTSHKLESLGIRLEQTSPYLLIVESDKRSIAAGYSELVSYRTNNSNITSYIGTNEMTASQYENLKTAFAQYASTSSEYAEQYMAMLEILIYDVEKYFNAEPYLCSMIEYVTVDIIPARYTLTGHGETVLSKTELGYYLSDGVGISHNTLDISSGGEIPADAVSIIILDPTSDISGAEADKLLAYLDRGGQITLFTSDEDLELPNLMKVADSYGLYAEKGIVGEIVEVEADVTEGDGEGESGESVTETTYVTDVSVSINTAHKSMSELVGLSISPIISKANSVNYKNKDGFDFAYVLTTSDKAYVGENKEDDSVYSRAVSVISEKKNGGTLLWFTGAESFTVPILAKDASEEQTYKVYSNISLVVSALALAPLSYTSTVELPDGSFYGERLMSVTETSYVLYTVVVIVLVVALSVFGVIYWYKRKKA